MTQRGNQHAGLKAQLESLLGDPPGIVSCQSAAGGSINEAFLARTGSGRELFVKRPRRAMAGACPREAEAMIELRRYAGQDLHVPEVLAWDETLLVMEAFHSGRPLPDWQERMGRGLALLHQRSRRRGFGLEQDNWLGFSPQYNRPHEDWCAFWRSQRLQPQLDSLSALLPSDDALLTGLEALSSRLDDLLAGVGPEGVLLHGDLWSGNAAADHRGQPVIFDPAAFYGHHEAEFGMMRLFGGFGPRCEAAYGEILPFAAESDRRIALYRLYHELNHLQLFGAGYYDACRNTLSSLL